MAISVELDNARKTNIKFEKVFKSKGTTKGNTNTKVNKKWSKKSIQNIITINKYARKEVPTKQGKK